MTDVVNYMYIKGVLPFYVVITAVSTCQESEFDCP